MAKDHSTTPSTNVEISDERMEFSFEFESISEAVEDVARFSTAGRFASARKISTESLESNMHVFPIGFEVLRLLYDQGQHKTLHDIIHQGTFYKEWSTQEKNIVSLMKFVAMSSIYADTRYVFHELKPSVIVASSLEKISIGDMSTENMIETVLLLRLLYFSHEVRQQIPPRKFSVLGGEAPSTVVSWFLQKEYFWAAEDVLHVCFRRSKVGIHEIKLPEIWSAIEWFLSNTDDERRIWAQFSILQTFCEGCLCQGLLNPDSDGSETPSPWNRRLNDLTLLVMKLEAKAQENEWKGSRATIRHDLLQLDWALWQRLAEGTLSVESETLRELYELNGQAQRNQDDRLQSGIQWRIEVLANSIDPDTIASTSGLIEVPMQIYTTRQKMIQRLDPTERRRFIHGSRKISGLLAEQIDKAIPEDEEPSASTALEPTRIRKTILLLGKTGTGKSTLLRTITGKYAATSNHKSTTSGIQKESCIRADGALLQVIDTPGFEDPEVSDYNTFERICKFLREDYLAARPLDCLFYLIDISSNRITASEIRQAKTLKSLVGENNWDHVYFIFTRGITDAGDDDELLRKKEHQDGMEKRYRREIFGDAARKGARFIHVGLDFGDRKELEELVGKRRVSPQREGGFIDNPIDEDDQETELLGEELSTSVRKNAHRPASYAQVDTMISAVLKIKTPVVFECQHEMCRLDRPFMKTQVALSFETQTRNEYDTATIDAAHYKLEREKAEAQRATAVKELEEDTTHTTEERQKIAELDADIADLDLWTEEVEAVRRQLEKDISAIEASAGWTPRLIVYNSTDTDLHLRAFPSGLLPGLIAKFENKVQSKKFRAIHCTPGQYRLEAFLGMSGNEITKSSVSSVTSGIIGTLAVGSPLHTAIATSVASFAASNTVRAIWNARQNEHFRSQVLENETGSVTISSSTPVKDLDPRIKTQMIIMEATRKGEVICIFKSDSFDLIKCTRLEIVGGPSRKDQGPVTEYKFDGSTREMSVHRVDLYA
ncbi:hypothetical protein D6D26_03933 [Aureobasidium pullulans]|nr:hypothetical protein D6D26_03933 [Aureobasidium pullulans]